MPPSLSNNAPITLQNGGVSVRQLFHPRPVLEPLVSSQSIVPTPSLPNASIDIPTPSPEVLPPPITITPIHSHSTSAVYLTLVITTEFQGKPTTTTSVTAIPILHVIDGSVNAQGGRHRVLLGICASLTALSVIFIACLFVLFKRRRREVQLAELNEASARRKRLASMRSSLLLDDFSDGNATAGAGGSGPGAGQAAIALLPYRDLEHGHRVRNASIVSYQSGAPLVPYRDAIPFPHGRYASSTMSCPATPFAAPHSSISVHHALHPSQEAFLQDHDHDHDHYRYHELGVHPHANGYRHSVSSIPHEHAHSHFRESSGIAPPIPARTRVASLPGLSESVR